MTNIIKTSIMYTSINICLSNGEMAERLKATVLKTVEDASPPRVRIPVSPPNNLYDKTSKVLSTGEVPEWPKGTHC